MFDSLVHTIEALDTLGIPMERKALLAPLRDYVKSKQSDGSVIQLQFICTHNSRRSHLGQVWAQTMASYFQVPNVHCYSGGTEATAVYSQTLKTLVNQGFEVLELAAVQNPIYAVKFSELATPVIAFSKTFDHPFNPRVNFAAIMTCDSADEACPFVAGSDARFAIRYSDPKLSDGTERMAQTYHERSLEIAREMKFVFE
jgi:arsenate reductase